MFDEVLDIMFRHARMLADWFGEGVAMRSFRRHVTWYTKGFRLTPEIRVALMRIETVDGLVRLFDGAERQQTFPPSAMRVVRGKTTGVQQRVALPAGYLDDLDDPTPPNRADDAGDEAADGG
jgi:hypothetical protein